MYKFSVADVSFYKSTGLLTQHVVPAGSDRSFGSTSPGRGSGKAEISNAKLAMMKKKLEPLPSRTKIESSTEDLSAM